MGSSRYMASVMSLVWSMNLVMVFCYTEAWADIAVPRPVVEQKSAQQGKNKPDKTVPAAKTAQQGQSKSQVDGKNPNLEPVDLQQKVTNPKWDQPYLLVAYGAVWLVLLFYLLMLMRRLSRTDSEIRLLEEQIREVLPREQK